MERRDFLKGLFATGAVAALPTVPAVQPVPELPREEVEYGETLAAPLEPVLRYMNYGIISQDEALKRLGIDADSQTVFGKYLRDCYAPKLAALMNANPNVFSRFPH